MKKIFLWILKFIIAFTLLIVHWSLFLAFVAFLFWRSRIQHRAEMEKASAAEAEVLAAQRILFECELVHVTKHNEDGTSRQSILYKCYRGDSLTLKLAEAEEGHQVEVWSKFGQIGELAPNYANQCADVHAQGRQTEGRIKKMLHRSEGTAAISCLIEVMAD